MTAGLVNFSNEIAAVVERAAQSVVAVHARPRIGTSGFIWRENFILTANEGIRHDEGIRVLFPDGRVSDAKLRGRDPGTDLAVLEVETRGAPAVNLASDTALKPGQFVMTVGRTSNTGVIASSGIVSGVASEWKSWHGGRVNPFVRLDAAVYPTSSGGAAVDTAGQVVGLVSTGLSRSSVLAITRTTIDRVAQKLLDQGFVGRPFLGIALQLVSLPADVKEKLQLAQDYGIMLMGIEPAAPAAAAGLMIGDVLLTGSGTALASLEALAHLLEQTGVDGTVALRVLRGGIVHDVSVKVAERPARGKK